MTNAYPLLATLLLLFSCACNQQTQQSKPALFATVPQLNVGSASAPDEMSRPAEATASPLKTGPIPSLKVLVATISKGNRVESAHIGFGGSPSTQWATYEMLKNTATEKQLVALTDHKNAAVRCYSFQALVAKKSPQTFNVLLRHLHDNAGVDTQSGCVGMHIDVGNYFTLLVEPGHGNPEGYKLTRNQIEVLDSIYLHDNSIQLLAKAFALMRAKPTKRNYVIIRKLVQINRDETALVALARYRYPSDRKLIATFFKHDATQSSALDAVIEYPDDYFYPFVVKIFEQEWKQKLYDYSKWKSCYKALAKYPRKETIALFDRTTESKDEFRHRTLCTDLLVAISKYPNKVYEPLKSKVKLDDAAMADVREGVNDKYY
jgi:hypothetical protein